MAEPNSLPPSAPFDPAQRAALDSVLVGASPVQRAWLAGFLAGMDVHAQPAATAAAAVAAPEPAAATPLTLLYATESGNSEALANRAAKLARKRGFKPRVVDMATADLASLATAQNLLVVAATWGEGEAPARAVPAYAALMADGAPRLDGLRFGVLALGDTSYAEFCAVGRAIDARLQALGGVRALDRADCDLDYEQQAAAWIDTALDRLRPATVAAAPAVQDDADTAPTEAVAEVIEHINLNSSRSAKETIHLALAFADGTPAYEPGDALELFPQNDPAMVDRVLASAGLGGDDALRQSLLVERDITTLSQVTVERFAQATGHASVTAMVAEGQARAWADGRQLVDLLQTYPAALTAQQLTDITRKLPPRAYSIASSRKEVGDEAHLLVAAVRYQSHDQPRAGVASVHIADRVRTGALLKVRLKQNPRFRLPADPATDIVMVGPGTGVAPFRAFVQERRAIGATGRSWLLFGDQRFTHDFLYQLEWQDALEDGSLTRIDVAFSRDQPDKVYVQDRILDNRRDFVDWMEGGAHFYVCGDAKAMAKDVRRAVVRAYADVKALGEDAAEAAVRQLEAAGRYAQDVY